MLTHKYCTGNHFKTGDVHYRSSVHIHSCYTLPMLNPAAFAPTNATRFATRLATPAAPPRAMALVLTLLVHVLLVLAWFAVRAQAPHARDGGQRITFLMQVPSKATPAPAAAVLAQEHARPRAPAPAALPMHAESAQTAAVAAPLPAATTEEVAAAAPSLRERALRDVAAIARELRPASPAASGEEAPRLRLARLIAGARSGRLWGADIERRVSPDGVAITRVTRNGHAACYMSGTVNFVPGILHDSARPQAVKCPPEDGGWSSE